MEITDTRTPAQQMNSEPLLVKYKRRIAELEAEVKALRNERAQAGKRAMLAEDINEELKSELADCQTRVNAAKTILIEAGFPAASKFIDN